MWLCKYDLLKECEMGHKDCVDCVIDKIRAEIEQAAFNDVNGSKYIFVNQVDQIINKYKTESEV